MPHSPSLYRLVLALLLLTAGVAHAQPVSFETGLPHITWSQVDPAKYTHNDWYLDTVNGQAAGYWHSSLTVEGDTILSTYEDYRVETHGGEESSYHNRTVWRETKDFKPISITVTTTAASDEVKKTYRFTDEGVELTSEQNGRTITRQLGPIQGEFLTGSQILISTLKHFKRGDPDVEHPTLDPIIGITPFVTRHKRDDYDKHPYQLADGSEVQARKVTTTYSLFPGFEMTNWVNDDGQVLGLAYEIDGVSFVSRLADETVKQTKFDPPEMSGLSVVVPDRPIQRVAEQRRIVYELSYDAGDSDIVPATTSQQAVESLGKGKARVTVDLNAKPQAADSPPTEAHLASSIMIDHEDELVQQLAKRAVARLKDNPSQREIALACKRFVTRHINGLSLAVGDGTASEAARTRTGDCSECSVLLAALLRVHGIPSRCTIGLVYAQEAFVGQKDVFVYHQWTQAWLTEQGGTGQWVDFDSAMWQYTAGHIALGNSAMGDNDQEDLFKIVPMQQDLKIKVIETE